MTSWVGLCISADTASNPWLHALRLLPPKTTSWESGVWNRLLVQESDPQCFAPGRKWQPTLPLDDLSCVQSFGFNLLRNTVEIGEVKTAVLPRR